MEESATAYDANFLLWARNSILKKQYRITLLTVRTVTFLV
jgi:hypothetical protein